MYKAPPEPDMIYKEVWLFLQPPLSCKSAFAKLCTDRPASKVEERDQGFFNLLNSNRTSPSSAQKVELRKLPATCCPGPPSHTPEVLWTQEAKAAWDFSPDPLSPCTCVLPVITSRLSLSGHSYYERTLTCAGWARLPLQSQFWFQRNHKFSCAREKAGPLPSAVD